MSDINLSNAVIAIDVMIGIAVGAPAMLFAAVGAVHARFANQGRNRGRWLRSGLLGAALGLGCGLTVVLMFVLSLG